MKTLVLCVDRDDDLGVKSQVTSPVIGRKNNLKALVALGMADPEDSDTNVMFMGLKLFKWYKDMGREVEVATICGDKNVGVVSDANLVRQFYSVIEQFSPDTLVLVSDGAEDEVILPVISQRVQVEHVERVVIKQAQNIESTFYIIMSALKNPKIAKKVIVPVAMALMLWGIMMILGETEAALGLMLAFFSLFLLSKALNLEGQVARMFEDTQGALKTRRYLLFGGVIISMTLIVSGMFYSFFQARNEEEARRFLYQFLNSIMPFIILAAVSYTLGNTFDTYMRKGKFIRSTWTIVFSLGAIYFIARTTMDFIGAVLGYGDSFNWENGLRYLAIAGLLLIITMAVHNYNKGKSKGKRKVGWMR